MSIGVHDFAIPHEHVQPTRDMVIIRLPLPPKMIGRFIMPDVVRDMAAYNVTAGRIVNMGPLAFQYKDGEGITRQDAKIGDWVIIRPYAGTLMQGGKLQLNSGWRYVSSFQDVLGIVPSDKMPDPATLLWDEDESQQGTEGAASPMPGTPPKDDFSFDAKKRTTYEET